MKAFFEKIIGFLIKRKGEVDDLSKFPDWRVGVSVAADWSWGVSMAVGMSIMAKKGIAPFLIWMLGNILAIPLVGFVRRFLPDSRHWPKFTLMLLVFAVIEYFAITLNMQAVLTGLGGGTDVITYSFLPREAAIWAVVVYGLFIVWYVNKGGLKILMLTDLGYFTVQMVSAIFIAGASFVMASGQVNSQLNWAVPGGMAWAPYAFIGIITGALAAGHQWQKYDAKAKSIFQITLWGGLFFAVYMLFVFLAGLYFSKNLVLGIAFLVIMVALATSTIDSAVSGVGYVARRFGIKSLYAGPIISVVIIFSWPCINNTTMANMWTNMANFRWPIIVFFIVVTAIIALAKNPKTTEVFKKLYLIR
ncbi:MAG TPA: hypothetical protein P5089_03985 [Candidatus Portnoybacteria bacterium]|nr:hypothetical protein [Candidatus Portnoybacteria bacterium]